MSGDGWTSWTLVRARPLMAEFLAKMRATGNVYLSCEAAGIPRSTAYYWRNKYKTFSDEWDAAKEDAVDKLDAEAWRRATTGQSDRLLMFLLKAHKPEVYSPVRRIEHSGTGEGGAIVVEDRYTDAQRVRGLGALFDAIRSGLVESDSGGDGALDASERAAVGGVPESSG